MFVQENPFPGLDYAIFFKSVTFTITFKNKPALENISISIPKGKTTALWDTQEQVNLP